MCSAIYSYGSTFSVLSLLGILIRNTTDISNLRWENKFDMVGQSHFAANHTAFHLIKKIMIFSQRICVFVPVCTYIRYKAISEYWIDGDSGDGDFGRKLKAHL